MAAHAGHLPQAVSDGTAMSMRSLTDRDGVSVLGSAQSARRPGLLDEIVIIYLAPDMLRRRPAVWQGE